MTSSPEEPLLFSKWLHVKCYNGQHGGARRFPVFLCRVVMFFLCLWVFSRYSGFLPNVQNRQFGVMLNGDYKLAVGVNGCMLALQYAGELSWVYLASRPLSGICSSSSLQPSMDKHNRRWMNELIIWSFLKVTNSHVLSRVKALIVNCV